jgi:cytochrome P450
MRAAEASTTGSRKIADCFDPFGADYLADPYPTLAIARDAAPVFYSANLDHWVVTHYADVRHVLRTTAEFSANQRTRAAQQTLSARRVDFEGQWLRGDARVDQP